MQKKRETLDEILSNPYNFEFYIVRSLCYHGNTVVNNDFFNSYGAAEFERVLEDILGEPVTINQVANKYEQEPLIIIETNRSKISDNSRAAALLAI